MALKLNVGVSRKVGLPGFSSVGASCQLELELSEELLHLDRDAFRRRVRDAYVTCGQAVHDELARHQPPPDGRVVPDKAARDRTPATPRQLRAIAALARRRNADLEGLLRDGYDVARPEDLTLAAASRLIDRLQDAAAV